MVFGMCVKLFQQLDGGIAFMQKAFDTWELTQNAFDTWAFIRAAFKTWTIVNGVWNVC